VRGHRSDRILVSPAEPAALRALGTTNSRVESFGVDFLFHSKLWGAVGVQRKELSDLVASVRDGRLVRELAQMKVLNVAVLLLEGKVTWSNDGLAMWSPGWTAAQHLGVTLSVQSSGVWIASTGSQDETIKWLSLFTKWVAKETQGSLSHRPTARGSSLWGSVDNRDYGIHLLQGIDGVGSELAARIWDRWGVPWAWTITEEELTAVDGIGKAKAKKIISALGQTS
jgi:ERCC4-type nuclease